MSEVLEDIFPSVSRAYRKYALSTGLTCMAGTFIGCALNIGSDGFLRWPRERLERLMTSASYEFGNIESGSSFCRSSRCSISLSIMFALSPRWHEQKN